MSTIGIGLMGFGRIGRILFRILYQSEDIRLRAEDRNLKLECGSGKKEDRRQKSEGGKTEEKN
jgi:homoserine dehydrogenase